jgi:peptidyl-prolyl cis-trans isomerase D
VNKLSSALGVLAVIAIAVVFILQFRPASNVGAAATGPQCAVEVRGACIPATTYKTARRLIGGRVDPNRLKAMGFGKKVAEGLVETWALNQDAKRLGINVSDEEITAEIATGRVRVSLPASDMRSLGYSLGLGEDLIFQIPVKNPKTKKFDAKYAEKQIRYASMMSPAEFREYQRSELIAARMRDLIRSRVRVGEAEAFDQFSRERSTVTLDYVRFDRRFFADLFVDNSQKAADAWAESHKEEVEKAWEGRKTQIMPECRSVREIFLKVDEMASDEEKAKVKARIERVKERVTTGGEDFADVARAVSDGTSSVRGGEVGCLLKGKAPKPLEDAANALAEGKVSDPIATEAGFYIIKMERVAKDAEAEKLGRAQTARELFIGQEAERLAVEGSKMVAAAVKGGKPIKDALDTYLAELKAKAPAKKDEKKDKKADDKKDKKADDKKKDDGDRAPVTMDTHPNRPTLETTLPFNISGDPIPGVREAVNLTKVAFGLEKPGDAPPDALAFESGWLVVSLKEKTPASKEQWEKNKELYLGGMRAAKANDALVAYVKRLTGQLAGDAKYTAALVEDKTTKGGDDAPPPPMDDGE